MIDLVSDKLNLNTSHEINNDFITFFTFFNFKSNYKHKHTSQKKKYTKKIKN